MNKQLLRRKLARKPNVKLDNLKYSKHLTDWFTENNLSLIINVHHFVVIEVSECVYDEIDPPIRMLIEQFNSYTEYVPRTDGIRIIGYSEQNPESCPLEIKCVIESGRFNDSHTLSIYRCCDRWTEISGIPIFDRPVEEIDGPINELIAKPGRFFSLT
jgi:hypothetical protein